MYDWYDRVIGQMGGIDSAMPLYISDAWNFGKCVKYCNGKNSLKAGRNANPVIIDTHLYWAFTEDNKRQSPQQITQQASNALSELDGNSGSVTDKGAVGVVVGEYSCVMTEDSWAKISKDQKDGAVRTFGQAQSRRHQLKAGGSFFWTYKMVSPRLVFVLNVQALAFLLFLRRTGWTVANGASSNKSRTKPSRLLQV